MFGKLNKKLLGFVAFFAIAVFALVFANQADDFKGAVTNSSNRCVDETVEEYALDLLEEIDDVEGDDYDDVEDEADEIDVKLQALALMFEEKDFDFDKEHLFLSEYDKSLYMKEYRNQIINSVNVILDDNKCDTFDNQDVEIEDTDFPDEFTRTSKVPVSIYLESSDIDLAKVAKFSFKTDEYIEGRRMIDEDTDTEVNSLIDVSDHVQVNFYAGDSASDVKEENFVFRANQVSLSEAVADDTDKDDIGDYEYQFYKGKDVDFYVDGLSGNGYYFGDRSFTYIPEGEYMFQIVIDGYEYEPEGFELKSEDVDVCELITDDAEVTGYSNKGFLEILIDKNEDLVSMDEDEAEDHDYSYLDALFAGMRDNYIYVYSADNEFDTADYRFARADSFGAMEAMVAIGLDNGCEIDFDDFEDLDSDFIDTVIEDNTITVELDDQLDDLDFLKVSYDEDDHVYEFKDNGKRDPILGVLTSFGLEEYYRYPYSYLMSAKELKADEKFAYTPKYYACDGYYTFCKFDEYLLRVGVAANAYTKGLVFDADYVPFEYKNSDAFKLLNKKNFYIAGEDYKFNFEAKDKTYDGKVEVASYYELDEPEFTMTDGKGAYEFSFDGSGGVQLGLSKPNSTDESIFSFNVLSKDAYDEAVRVLGSIDGKGECALDLEGQRDFVSTASTIKITMECNKDSDRTVLNLYDDGTDKAVATVYNCLNSVQCDGRTNIIWNATANGQPVPNGKYYFKVSFEIDGKKVVPEASEAFVVNNTGGSLPGPGGAFPDVPANHPYLNGINWMRAQGFIQGYPDGTFRPEVCVNRAELVKMVSGSVGVLSGSLGQTRSYVDVNPSDWFYRFVMDATNYGWVQGYPDGTFRPANCVTRAEAIKVAMVANNLQTVLGQGSYFADVNPNDWFYGFVNTAYVKQIVGTSHVYNSQFRPNESMTRAEVAEMLYRISRSYGSQPYAAAPVAGEVIYR